MLNKQPKKVHIGFGIDRSGSMEPLANEVITGFNEQVDDISKRAPETTDVSLVSFASTVKEHFIGQSPATLEKLTKETYSPSGWTALYDGTAYLIEKLSAMADSNDPDTVFLVTIISDGAENHSKEYAGSKGRNALASRIKKLQETGRWTFTYLGANQDLAQVSADLNIPIRNTAVFGASAGGTRAGMQLNSLKTARYLNKLQEGQQSVVDFYGA